MPFSAKAVRMNHLESKMSEETPLTISVVEAGRRYFGLSRGASYQAAERGDIPTIRVGRLLRVPVRAMESRLDAASSGVAYHDRTIGVSAAPPAADRLTSIKTKE
jgi:hypothetical protein